MLVIARACKSNALPDTARDLLLASKSMSNWGRDVNATPAAFQQKLGEDLAHAQIWQTILDYAKTDKGHDETRMNVQKLLATPINNRIEMLFALVLDES